MVMVVKRMLGMVVVVKRMLGMVVVARRRAKMSLIMWAGGWPMGNKRGKMEIF